MALYNYFVPATGQLGNFQLDNLPFGQSFVNVQDSGLYGLGFQNWAEINPYEWGGSPQVLLESKDKAAKAGNKWWEKAINAVLVYGLPVLQKLVEIGILKNKNTAISDLGSGKFDNAAMQQFMQNGGLTSPTQQPREAEIFGMKLSTVIMIGAGLLIFLLFQPEKGRKK